MRRPLPFSHLLLVLTLAVFPLAGCGEDGSGTAPVADASTVSRPRPYPRTLTRTSSSFVVASTFTTWPGVSSMISVICSMGQPLVSSGWRSCLTTKLAEVVPSGVW